MWAINKSPLIVGAILDDRISKTSLATLSNKEVIAINQDSLAKQAQLAVRYTEEEWDVWQGDLSNGRRVVAIANWRNQSRSVDFGLPLIKVGSANVRDVWAAKDLGKLSGTQKVSLAAHELKLWVLSDITAPQTPLVSTGYYSAANATIEGSASVSACGTGTCLPIGSKVGNIGQGAGVHYKSVSAKTAGKKLVGVDFINYDYAFQTAWDWGSNTRNVTISVNGGQAKRWVFPLSGENWSETGRLLLEADGFKAGNSNEVVFRAVGSAWAPDQVGLEVFE